MSTARLSIPTLQVRLTLPTAWIDRIERAKRDDSLSRNDAIRRVLEVGLKTVEAQ
jgi:hypothetical protein